MAELIGALDGERLRRNLAQARERVRAAARRAGRDPAAVELLAAVKYVSSDQLPVLAAAGIELVGENRAQALEHKIAAHPDLFTWDFIGHLQSRKVARVVPLVRLLHSVASDSALAQLARDADAARPGFAVLVEVNVAGDPGKSGVAPSELGRFIERCPVPVAGLMTMPPLARRAQESRGHFAALRELSDQHGLERLSMGTSQDYEVAVEEGATIVRLGRALYL